MSFKIATNLDYDCDQFPTSHRKQNISNLKLKTCLISACSCDASGSTEEICTKSLGNCLCREGYSGERCDRCEAGWWGYPDCQPCECSTEGSSTQDGGYVTRIYLIIILLQFIWPGVTRCLVSAPAGATLEADSAETAHRAIMTTPTASVSFNVDFGDKNL